MKTRHGKIAICFLLWMTTALVFSINPVSAHCDGMDGPVVKAAQKALAAGDVNLILVWIQPKDEPEIRDVFQKTLAVRRLSAEAREMADTYFFETLVRLHRAGEGEPFTGIKPAGRDLGPAIPAADGAIEQKSAQKLQTLMTSTIQDGLHERFKKALAKSSYDKNDVAAGREFVKAYVEFIHYAERLYQAAEGHAQLDAHAAEAHASSGQ